MTTFFYRSLLLFTFLVCAGIVQAQESPLDPNAVRGQGSQTGVYVLTKPDDLSSISLAVKVVGNVGRTGLYVVRRGMRLDDILGIAGGPAIPQRRKQDKTATTVTLSRRTDSGRVVIYNELWDNMMVSTEEFPVMQDGDIVEVRTITETGLGRSEYLNIGIQAGLTVFGVLVNVLLYRSLSNN
jgi:hypothetical protein